MFNMERVVRVKSLDEAYELNQDRTNVVLGGFMWMKMANRSIQSAIDLSGLGLDTIEETDDEYRIGCMCSLRTLELHEGIHREFDGAIRHALEHIVGVQFRNGATVGGSVYGRFGFSDVTACLLALDTWVELHKGGRVTLDDFMKMKADNDILVRIIIRRDGRKASYQSQRISKTDFPVIAVSVALNEDKVFVSVGARPGKATLVVRDAADLGDCSPEALRAFSEALGGEIAYGKDMRGGADYRKALAGVYIRRGLTDILEGK